MSPFSLEALMFDFSLFEESLLKDPDEKVLTFLSEVYGKKAIKGVQELLKDATPLKMAASVSTFPISCLLSIYVYTFYFLPIIIWAPIMLNFLIYMWTNTSMAIGLVMMKSSRSPVETLSLLQRTLSCPHAAQIYPSQSMRGRCGAGRKLQGADHSILRWWLA